jgi:general secretion pathway protein K
MSVMRGSSERGSIAVLALWAMAIVFVLLAAAGFTTRTEVLIARNELASARAKSAAEAGTQLGLARLLARKARGPALFDAAPQMWQDGAARVAISIDDEAGKIDINQAPLALLTGLFKAVGRPEVEALLLACRIVAHRGGAAEACPEAGDEKPALFTAPEELAALPGFGDQLYVAIADCVTVATGASAIDPEAAPRLVLMALPGVSANMVDGWIAERRMMREMASGGGGFETLPALPFLMMSPERDFTVSAVASLPEGARARVDLQVRLTGLARHPYAVMAYRTPPLRRRARR